MTPRQEIQAIRDRIARGHALPGDAAVLAKLIREMNTCYDLPPGQSKPAKVECSPWSKRKGVDYKWTANREDFTEVCT